MKDGFTTFTLVVTLAFSGMTAAQEEPAVIIGKIADGTLPTPVPPEELPSVEILKTKTVQLSNRRVTISQIADPGLPGPRPKLPDSQNLSLKEIEAYRNSPAVKRWQSETAKTTHLFITATEIDGRATFLTWRHKGLEYHAWSNADWKILSGFAQYKKGEKRFVSLIMNSQMRSADLTADSPYQLPTPLPAEPGTYWVTKGDLSITESYEGISALHELYLSDYTRLAEAYTLRVQRSKQRAAELRAHPPKPKDIVLHYWKVQPKSSTTATEGGSR